MYIRVENTDYHQTKQHNDEVSDDDLLHMITHGDKTAYNLLIQRYLGKVWRLSFSILKNEQEAEDATQDVFLSLWQSLENWDKNGKAKFSTWIYRVTFNKCIDIKRKKKPTTDTDSIDVMSEEQSAYQSTLQRQISDRLNILLCTLPDTQKEALQLYYFKELSAIEVATQMNKSEQSVRSLLKRARASLKDTIQRDDHIQAWVPQEFLKRLEREYRV
ncbi:MAG: RNA polymerase sigma factor [Alphaproteobacteria bacterium]